MYINLKINTISQIYNLTHKDCLTDILLALASRLSFLGVLGMRLSRLLPGVTS